MKKGMATNLILILAFLLGLSLLLYPTFSDYWNSLHQSRAVSSYVAEAEKLDSGRYDEILAAAHEYNAYAAEKPNQWAMSEEDLAWYESLLSIGGSNIMAQIEIPSIGVNLPVYHGTSDGVLQIAAGHLSTTSLPVGGLGTHAVLSGHRGLPSAKLFTDLDDLREGDLFSIRVLNEILTYEVDQILIVEPTDIASLEIDPMQDYVTLVTCTPYGINTHRLLVRGHRVENFEQEKAVRVTADAVQVEPIIVAPFVAVPMLLVLLLILLFGSKKKKQKK